MQTRSTGTRFRQDVRADDTVLRTLAVLFVTHTSYAQSSTYRGTFWQFANRSSEK
jgi:hypothetical protein